MVLLKGCAQSLRSTRASLVASMLNPDFPSDSPLALPTSPISKHAYNWGKGGSVPDFETPNYILSSPLSTYHVLKMSCFQSQQKEGKVQHIGTRLAEHVFAACIVFLQRIYHIDGAVHDNEALQGSCGVLAHNIARWSGMLEGNVLDQFHSTGGEGPPIHDYHIEHRRSICACTKRLCLCSHVRSPIEQQLDTIHHDYV